MTLSLLRHLAGSSVEPRLFLLKRQGAFLPEVPPELPLRWAAGPDSRLRGALPRVVGRLAAEAARVDVVVGALELDATYLAWAAARLARRPVIGWVHTALAPYLQGFSRLHPPVVRALYPRLDGVIFVSRGAALSAAAVVRLPEERSRVIPNLLDAEAVRRGADAALPAWAGALDGQPFIVAAGRLEPAKGFDLLLRAHAELRARGHDVRAVILGQGPEREALQRLASELGTADRVILPGFHNPWPLMQRARAFVLPSRVEGFGLTLLEAMSVGCPALATDCEGPREVLDGGRAGVLVTPDPQAIAAGLERVLSQPEVSSRLAQAGAARVRDFAPERIVPRWEQLLAEVAR